MAPADRGYPITGKPANLQGNFEKKDFREGATRFPDGPHALPAAETSIR
ncbi:MAG TPA: hypothetical protein VEL74_08940 [Thermoanaerobaculia bacterium]|nr:hypothetical protein [Thermoanaerobaculia bacterium]